MKKLTLTLFLATFHVLQAGEIADYYYKQTRVDDLNVNGTLSPPKRQSTTHGITEIGIERSPCFGSCPVYVCVIRSDGTIRYHGKAHVERIGDWEAKIDPSKFHNLANFIVESDYLRMQDTVACNVTDGDSVFTTFVLNGNRKVFRNYVSSGPPKLWALQQLIDCLSGGVT